MRIIVCIKQVPGSTQVEIDEKNGTLKRDGVESKLNPYDLYALETAMRLKEEHSASVAVLTMGPPQCEEAVREAFMMGADSGFILSDRRFGGADVLATSFTLAQGVRRVIISAGSRGCYYADNMGQRLWSRTRPLQQVENATGAGDSFMAGLLYSAAQRYRLGDTMDFAMGAALAALQARTTINPAISPELIWQLVREQKRPRTPVIPTGLTGK